MIESIERIKEFEQTCNEFEFSRVEDLSTEERGNLDMDKGLVVIEKSINPGITIIPIKDGDFVGFLIDKIITNKGKGVFENSFSGFK